MDIKNIKSDLFCQKDASNDEQTMFILPQEVQNQIQNLKEGESTTFTFEIPLNDDLTT